LLYIGKLDKNKLGKYKNKITTNTVVITNEQIEHIQKRHPGDYEEDICGGKILYRPRADGKQGATRKM